VLPNITVKLLRCVAPKQNADKLHLFLQDLSHVLLKILANI